MAKEIGKNSMKYFFFSLFIGLLERKGYEFMRNYLSNKHRLTSKGNAVGS